MVVVVKIVVAVMGVMFMIAVTVVAVVKRQQSVAETFSITRD